MKILLLFLFVLCCVAAQQEFRIKQFIISRDVLLPSEDKNFKMESDVNAYFFVLDNYSKLTDLGRSFPIELAYTGSCLKEMEVLNTCLQNRGEPKKTSISTLSVQRSKAVNIKQIEITKDGQKILIDEDCTNNQIDLEQCIVNNNRYYPCQPPEKDLTKYRKLFSERVEKFADVLRQNGFQLTPANLQFDFGDLKSYEILNYNEEGVSQLSANFLKNFSEEKLPEAYETFKRDFLELKKVIPQGSKRFIQFEKALKDAACSKQISNYDEVLSTTNDKISEMRKKVSEAETALNNIQKSIPVFLEQIPRQLPDTCNEKHFYQVDYKIKVIEFLEWKCNDEFDE